LAWVAGYVMRQFTCPKAVAHPSTNRARCRTTALIESNALPLHQTANVSVNIANVVVGCSLSVVIPAARLRTPGDRTFPITVSRAWNALPPNVSLSLSCGMWRHLFGQQCCPCSVI